MQFLSFKKRECVCVCVLMCLCVYVYVCCRPMCSHMCWVNMPTLVPINAKGTCWVPSLPFSTLPSWALGTGSFTDHCVCHWDPNAGPRACIASSLAH